MKIATNATVRFKPFSKKQTKIMTWWTDASPVKDSGGIIADGAIRSGKTMSMSLSFVIWAMDTFEGQIFIMCGKTIASFRRNVLIWLTQMLIASGYQVRERRGENMIVVSHGNRENHFYIFGGQDESSQDLIQGITAAGAFFDEVALMPESFVNQATGRCSVEGSKLWFNCNPGPPSHYFKQQWIDKIEKKGMIHLHFNMGDNPSLSEEIKERYRDRYSGVFYRRYVLGEWAAADGVIYEMFDPDIHVVDIAPKITRTWIGVDYGHTNPTVFLLAGEGIDGRMYVLREYYHKGAGNAENGNGAVKSPRAYSADLQKFRAESVIYKGAMLENVVVDPSAAALISQLREDGVPSVVKADNSVLPGISLISSLIGADKLRVLRCCKHTLDEFASYAWDAKAAKLGEDKPVKTNDHCLTGETIVHTVEGNIPIKDLVGKTGQVKCYNEQECAQTAARFSNVRMTKRNAPVYTVELCDGKTVTATDEHPFLTKSGWKKLKELSAGDEILCIGDQY